MRILLVEDEINLADALEHILKKEKYLVDVAYEGNMASEFAETGVYDIIILDRMLPNKDGLQILKEIRSKNIKSSVIFLTAKDSVKNKIEGLDAGADDYLVKPFSKDELLARIRALSRRPEQLIETNEISVGNVSLLPKECQLIVNDNITNLTSQESQLLEYLMLNKRFTLSKDQILDKVWGFNNEVFHSNVELYIHYVRKKLKDAKANILIKTVRGSGYCLEEDLDGEKNQK